MSFDDLVRGAGENARSNIATAFRLDEHDLYRELGIHSRDLAVTGIAPLSADDFPRGRSSKLEDSELSTLGRQIFRRWCASLHELVCGTDAEDNDLRQQILHVISGSKETLAAVSPYPAKAGCPTVAGRRRRRTAPAGMTPAVSWS